jgi:hypothetical protein
MNIFFVFAIPTVLVIIGMILNNLGSSFSQPASSPEQDPAKRSEAERQAYRAFFDQQRTRFFKRQKRIGQYGWLVLAVFVVSFWWMYFDTVNKTAASKQIVALQTVPVAEAREVVLTVTLKDGHNVKYLIKSAKADTLGGAVTDGFLKEPVSSWELSGSGTALSIGDTLLPVGIAVKISN